MPNKLINEKSPYLLQHAHNPVNWYPWGEEAFARARAENKPIFLSVGYSTCHWCHVMERESFEDDAIASILNAHYVSIKVDREERPDVDRVYMTALQAMGQDGGWPMSMFLTSDLRPFYGGTYFPPTARQGRASFSMVLTRIHEIWTRERENVFESAAGITRFLEDTAIAAPPTTPTGAPVAGRCMDQIASTFDRTAGGFGSGPKFPRPAVFHFLLRHFAREHDESALAMTAQTLRAMAAGGMYDQLGGGFHRYAVDANWRIPHFEKMLYDQAQLVQSYLETYQASHDAFFAGIARETVEYVLRDMTSPEGAFYSAEDADSPLPENPSESGEGAFYLWSAPEIRLALGEEAQLFSDYFGVRESGNAPFDPQGEFAGKNILYRPLSLEDAGKQSGLTPAEAATRIARARGVMLDLRSRRQRPLRDDKVIAAWNGLMIGACAQAGRILEHAPYAAAAERAAEFVMGAMKDPSNGLLLRRYRDHDGRYEAQLSDYAFLVSGLLDLYEATGHARWLKSAAALTEEQIARFYDHAHGGFFDTPGDDSSIIVRMKERHDGAEPSGNSVACRNLILLARMLDRRDWTKLAEETVAQFQGMLAVQPIALPYLSSDAGFLAVPPSQVVFAGPKEEREGAEFPSIVACRFLPDTVLLYTDCGKECEELAALNPLFAGMTARDGKATAYVCRDFVCELPAESAGELAVQLDRAGTRDKR
jgi:hypothetical protein